MSCTVHEVSVIRTVEMVMGANGSLDSCWNLPKNQRKTVNSLMKYASMTAKYKPRGEPGLFGERVEEWLKRVAQTCNTSVPSPHVG